MKLVGSKIHGTQCNYKVCLSSLKQNIFGNIWCFILVGVVFFKDLIIEILLYLSLLNDHLLYSCLFFLMTEYFVVYGDHTLFIPSWIVEYFIFFLISWLIVNHAMFSKYFKLLKKIYLYGFENLLTVHSEVLSLPLSRQASFLC